MGEGNEDLWRLKNSVGPHKQDKLRNEFCNFKSYSARKDNDR